MAKKLQLQIPEPCHENWNAMTPSDKGRFCGSCQKQVVDFTNMSDREVLTYFQTASSSVCGRFQQDQLHRDMSLPKKSIPWARYFFKFTLPLFLASLKAGAQTAKKPGVNDTVTVVAYSTKACTVTMGMVTRPVEIKKTMTVSGVVKGEDGVPINNATIMIKGSRIGAIADAEGKYNLEIKKDTIPVKLVASAVGFEYLEKEVKFNETNDFTLSSQQLVGLVGAVVTVRKVKSVPLIQTIFRDTIFSQFKVFPNPAQSAGSLHLQWKGSKSGDFLLVIRDLAGKEMLRQELAMEKKSIQTIQLPGLLPGSFFAVLTDKKSGKIFTEKFVVQ